MQSVQQILVAAKALIQQRNKWTQHTYARNIVGEPVDPTSQQAFCWCTIGAIAKVTNGAMEAHNARMHLQRTSMHMKLDRFNDSMTHEAVLEAFDKAIKAV